VKQYKVYEMLPQELKHTKTRRFLCLNFFAPIFLAIPISIETGLVNYLFALKAEKAIQLF
jgi:hypothetical protein